MKAAGLDFFGGIESSRGDLNPRALRVGVGRNDIEEITGNAAVSKVGGDAGAHGSGAENGNFIDALHHEASGERVPTAEKMS